MVRLVLLMLALLCLPAAAKGPEAFIRLHLESDDIFLGDTVILEIESTGLIDPIDLSPLREVADTRRETVGTRIAVIDGNVVEIRSRRIELVPRSLGTAIIGPLTAGEVVSNSVSVKVFEERRIDWTPTAEDIRIEQTVSDLSPWLQQELVLDVRLKHRHPVFDDRMVLPELAGYRVVPLHQERRTVEQTDGGWAVISWRWLVFPERSGPLTIPGARYIASIAKSRAERAMVDLQAPDLALVVKPAAFADGEWWLAARSVTMRDEWSTDPKTLSAGDEIERIITVEADGVLPEQIPDIAMGETRGLAVTRLGEDRSGFTGDDGSHAKASFRFLVRAMSPVPVFLDTVRLRWWDTETDAARDAIIPARRIEIGIPDREKLLQAAELQPEFLSRLRGAVVPWIAGTLVLAALVLGAGAVLLWYRRRRPDGSRAALREAITLARQGDAEGLYRKLRALAAAGGAMRDLRERFEAEFFAPSCPRPDLGRWAVELEGHRAYAGRPAKTRERLPPL